MAVGTLSDSDNGQDGKDLESTACRLSVCWEVEITASHLPCFFLEQMKYYTVVSIVGLGVQDPSLSFVAYSKGKHLSLKLNCTSWLPALKANRVTVPVFPVYFFLLNSLMYVHCF